MDATPEHEPREATRRFRILPWLMGLFIAIALYVLSIGPARILVNRGTVPQSTFYAFYRPLGELYMRSTLVEHFIDWYGDLWTAKRQHSPGR